MAGSRIGAHQSNRVHGDQAQRSMDNPRRDGCRRNTDTLWRPRLTAGEGAAGSREGQSDQRGAGLEITLFKGLVMFHHGAFETAGRGEDQAIPSHLLFAAWLANSTGRGDRIAQRASNVRKSRGIRQRWHQRFAEPRDRPICRQRGDARWRAQNHGYLSSSWRTVRAA